VTATIDRLGSSPIPAEPTPSTGSASEAADRGPRGAETAALGAFRTLGGRRTALMLLGANLGGVACRIAFEVGALPRIDVLLLGAIASLAFALGGLGVGMWLERRDLRAMLTPRCATELSQVLAHAHARVRVRGTLGAAVTSPGLRPLFRLRLEDGEVLVDESNVLAFGQNEGATFSEGDEIVVAGDCEVKAVHEDYRSVGQAIVIGGRDGIEVARAR
jgi:hypothetical protein